MAILKSYLYLNLPFDLTCVDELHVPLQVAIDHKNLVAAWMRAGSLSHLLMMLLDVLLEPPKKNSNLLNTLSAPKVHDVRSHFSHGFWPSVHQEPCRQQCSLDRDTYRCWEALPWKQHSTTWHHWRGYRNRFLILNYLNSGFPLWHDG